MSLTMESQLFQFGKLDDTFDEFFVKDGDLVKKENITRFKKGSVLTIERRYGFADFTDVTGGGICRGLFQWIKRDGTRRLVGIFGTSVKVWTHPTWTTLTTISNTETDQHFTFAQWIFNLYFGNGNEDPLKWDHITTPSSVTAAPKSKFMLMHKDQLFHFNITNDSRVNNVVRDASFQFQWSDIADPDTYDLDNVINVNGEITGAFSAPADVLIIFTKTRTEILTGSDGNDFYKLVLDPLIGCVSHYGIIGAEGFVYFPSVEGIFKTSGLDRPSMISENISKIYSHIHPASMKHIKGAYDRAGRRLYWLVQTTDNVNDVGSPEYVFNTLLVYDLNIKEWEIYKTDIDLTSVIEYQDVDNEHLLLFGTYDGHILALKDKDHEDHGSASSNVPFIFETGPLFFKAPQMVKNFHTMRVFLKSADRRTIPITYYTDTESASSASLVCSSSTSRNRFLATVSPSTLQYVLGTSSSLQNVYDFVDVPINRSGHYLKIRFGDNAASSNDNLEFNILAFEIFHKKQLTTGSPEYV